MDIRKNAVAGTMESSDVMVNVSPSENGRQIEISSVVYEQYGDAIRKVVESTLDALAVNSGSITILDHGAIDCVIEARVETAVKRGSGEEK